MAGEVARRYARPQDVEWAIAERRVFLLQARPMTALSQAVEWVPPGPGLWARNFRIGEWLPEPMTPLFSDWLLPLLEDGYLHGLRDTAGTVLTFEYAAVHGWYYNAPPTLRPGLLGHLLVEGRGRIVKLLLNGVYRTQHDPAKADSSFLGGAYRSWKEVELPAYAGLVAEADRQVQTATRERLIEVVDQVGDTAGGTCGHWQ